MKRSLPPVYAILNLENHEAPAAFAESLLRGGIRLLQIRSKTLSGQEVCRAAEMIRTVAAAIGVSAEFRLIINDSVELCREAKADGVHLGQEDVAPETARAILGPDALIGLSTHSCEQIRSAPITVLDYLAAGPVFHSATKSGHAPLLGLAGLREMARLSPLPLVAIGGINEENADSVLETGVASVAVIDVLRRSKNLSETICRLSGSRHQGK